MSHTGTYGFNYDTCKTIGEGVIIQLMPPTNILESRNRSEQIIQLTPSY